jgi:hypothetical protein
LICVHQSLSGEAFQQFPLLPCSRSKWLATVSQLTHCSSCRAYNILARNTQKTPFLLTLSNVGVQTCLFAKSLLSNGCCIAPSFAVVAWQRVYMPQYIRRGADKFLVFPSSYFPICSTTKRFFLGWVKGIKTTKSKVGEICRVNIFFNPIACCFLYKGKDLSAPSYMLRKDYDCRA